jgi:hypothetical protein
MAIELSLTNFVSDLNIISKVFPLLKLWDGFFLFLDYDFLWGNAVT